MTVLATLATLRQRLKPGATTGLSDALLAPFLDDPDLIEATRVALAESDRITALFPALSDKSEAQLAHDVQEGYVNFYAENAINPYVAIAAKGPWLITAGGAVIHDSGGYGMLGFGHAPSTLLEAMAKPWVMANVMTPSFSQKRLSDLLYSEIGHVRGSCPYSRFLCLNSGSEAVTLAGRITDIQAKAQTAEGQRHAGKTIKFLALKGAFHGRTDRPAQVSDSSISSYRAHLASFSGRDNLLLVAPNDVSALEAVFAQASSDGVYIEAMFMEPVMGEGNPGMAVTREFYDAARALTLAHGSMLVVDSIQAGLRGQGCLSLMDYPGFEHADAPDMETYSKALNGGQFPLSVLAMTARAASVYQTGVYGNTMTTNPRALEVACATLKLVTPQLRANIRDRGIELVNALLALGEEFPGLITQVQGTGLLLAAELNPDRVQVMGDNGIELRCRQLGLGVIHGGKNALRFTPHFAVDSREIRLIIAVLRQVFSEL